MNKRRSVLREEGQSGAQVGYAELFFDLVYVFAVTQLSHFLLSNDDIAGLAQTAVLTAAVWWAWTFMTWATNWLDPDRFWVRLMIFAMMLLGLVMGASLPTAFRGGALVFALAYTGSQVLRSLFVAWALRRDRPETARTMLRASAWFTATGLLWVGGAFVDAQTRLMLWAFAIALELLAPLNHFRLPGMAKGEDPGIDVTGEHMAERCGLFIIVALGEGILVTGATVAGMTLEPVTLAAFGVAFLGSVAFWWIYFDRGADQGSDQIEHADDAGEVARTNYAYLHLPIVAGLIVAAVSEEMLVGHPLGHLEPEFVLAAIGGPALFLAGCMVFKRQFIGLYPLSHLFGLGAFAGLAVLAVFLRPVPLLLAGGTVLILFAVAAWEWRSFHGGWTNRARPERREPKIS